MSKTFLAALLGAVVLAGTVGIAPAAADSFYFGVSSGHRHRHHHPYYPPYYRPYYGPRVVYAPPPVYYVPPPPVVYAPPPPVYQSYPMTPGMVVASPISPIYQNRNGQYCREYQSTAVVNGQPQQTYGTACQMPDGSWRIVN